MDTMQLSEIFTAKRCGSPPCKTVLARPACSVFSDHSSNKTVCVSSFIMAAENCFSFVIDATKRMGHILRKTDAQVVFPEICVAVVTCKHSRSFLSNVFTFQGAIDKLSCRKFQTFSITYFY